MTWTIREIKDLPPVNSESLTRFIEHLKSIQVSTGPVPKGQVCTNSHPPDECSDETARRKHLSPTE